MKIIGLVLIITISLPLLVFAEVYISAEEATKKIFPTLQRYEVKTHIVDNQEFKVFTVFRDKKVIGWSVVTDEMGKNMPITFLVGIDIKGKVLGVYVLEFRDLFGSEVRRRSFLRQFHGKTSKDPIIVGRDIDAVTSATISSKAAASAVRKSLKIVEEF